ncbi:hypothetical protein [Marinomonas sp.]
MHHFLVVLYGKSFDESSTLQTLQNHLPSELTARVLLWNNGPDSLRSALDSSNQIARLKQKGVKINFKESLENRSLSEIYNEVWDGIDTSLTILDDDTYLTSAYFQGLKVFATSDSLVLIPKIEVGEHLVYPKFKGIKNVEQLSNNDLIQQPAVSVMSAVTVKPELKTLLNKKFPDLFDVRFCFYGIDSTFFKRLRMIGYKTFFLASPLNHSLSSEDEVLTDFRVRERLIDSCLQIRNYPSLGAVKGLLLNLRAFGAKRVLKERNNLFYSLWHGVHPRIKQ